MKRILFVLGTRPEAIKLAPLVNEFIKNDEFDVKVCSTGQHKEMLLQVFEIFNLQPDFNLDIMKPGQDLFDITTRVISALKETFNEYKPDLVFVQGDTTTSMAAALAAFYLQIPVAHVEAGLRTYSRYSPWPEEINRQLTSRLATYHFPPTELSKKNLVSEGIGESQVLVSGNTVIDALLYTLNRINEDVAKQKEIEDDLMSEGLSIDERKIILITGHRRENFGHGFKQICLALIDIALNYPDVKFVYPVHLNPNVQEPVKNILGKVKNIFLIKPLSYEPFVHLMNKSYFILTDSGGVQEEAPSLGKPVLVMRENTERPEAVEVGTVKMVGTNKSRIILEASNLLDNQDEYNKMSLAHNPYGDGKASSRIMGFIAANLK